MKAAVNYILRYSLCAFFSALCALNSFGQSATLTLPLDLTAHDFITKVYGVLDTRLNKQQALDASRRVLNLIPQEDEYGLWLETSDGYTISYYGMMPEVSARAAYNAAGNIADYGFFFLFPYEPGQREQANARQAQFSGALLQELMDMGLQMQIDELSDALFEVIGDYTDDTVDVKLIEEHNTDTDAGRFILIFHVNPSSGYTAEN